MSPRYPVVASATETHRFGFETVRVTIDGGVLADAAAALRETLDPVGARLVILRFPSELLGLVGAAGLDDWQVHPAGTLVYWEWDALDPGHEVDEAGDWTPRDDELEAVIGVVLDSFDGYLNHYSANPSLPPGVAEVGYAEWTRTIVASGRDRVFVVRDGGTIVGAAVVGIDDGVWDVRLAGIASSMQRRGHYRRLIRAVERAAKREAVSGLVISTQAHNIAVQRAWASLGWRPLRAVDTVHLMRRDPAPVRG